MVLRAWFQTTPAGAAAQRVLSPHTYLRDAPNVPAFVQFAGDTGACDMHDGHHFPLGVS